MRLTLPCFGAGMDGKGPEHAGEQEHSGSADSSGSLVQFEGLLHLLVPTCSFDTGFITATFDSDSIGKI